MESFRFPRAFYSIQPASAQIPGHVASLRMLSSMDAEDNKSHHKLFAIREFSVIIG